MLQNISMVEIFHLLAHVVLIGAALGKFVLLWGIIWEIVPSGPERIMRSLASISGVLLYVGAKTFGLTIPGLLLASLAMGGAYTTRLFGAVFPAATGFLVSWFVCRFLSSRDARKNLVGMRLLALVVSVTLMLYLDLYTSAFDAAGSDGFRMLMPNLVFLLSVLIFAVLRYHPLPAVTETTAALLALALGGSLLIGTAQAQESPRLYAPDGTYLGNLNTNQYDPNSVSNPYGRYGNPFSPDSINNRFGKYGNPYSPDSVRNPYGR
jgi:hypothetical protein